MKPVTNTRDRLVIEDRPWLLGGMICAMGGAALLSVIAGTLGSVAETILVACLGAGALWFAWHFFPFQTFVFDRGEAAFTRRIHRITGETVRTLPLAEILAAEVQVQSGDGPDMERLALRTGETLLPLEYGFGSVPRAALAETINRWLADQT